MSHRRLLPIRQQGSYFSLRVSHLALAWLHPFEESLTRANGTGKSHSRAKWLTCKEESEPIVVSAAVALEGWVPLRYLFVVIGAAHCKARQTQVVRRAMKTSDAHSIDLVVALIACDPGVHLCMRHRCASKTPLRMRHHMRHRCAPQTLAAPGGSPRAAAVGRLRVGIASHAGGQTFCRSQRLQPSRLRRQPPERHK